MEKGSPAPDRAYTPPYRYPTTAPSSHLVPHTHTLRDVMNPRLCLICLQVVTLPPRHSQGFQIDNRAASPQRGATQPSRMLQRHIKSIFLPDVCLSVPQHLRKVNIHCFWAPVVSTWSSSPQTSTLLRLHVQRRMSCSVAAQFLFGEGGEKKRTNVLLHPGNNTCKELWDLGIKDYPQSVVENTQM